ncbi:phage portal protein [Shewanella xiamenensis]|uniref:phage portal protein n=1 Tax=Shewanella xiamenensis TaxID=332186 RepID=UPI00217D8BC0|nr:phage portal protein [Shewanella xiamenensis]MCT8871549.1 phage portal protein [Shewanella xiamenensis]UWH43611.1 phage portal protein [Shewanella xiamenensis]
MKQSKSLALVIAKAASQPFASLDNFMGKTLRLTDGDFWAQLMATSKSGKTVNVNTAMQLAAVWACVRRISETVAMLPLGLYERQSDGGRIQVQNSLSTVLSIKPNADMTAMQFWEAVLASLLLKGNAFIEIHRSGGEIIALDFLMPHRMDIDLDDSGSLIYWYTPRNGPRRQIKKQNMMHIPAFSLDGLIGLSTISYGANVFGGAMSAEDVSASTFKNGMTKTVAFKVDRVMTKPQREEFREYVKTITGAMNAGRSPVLEQGITPELIGINPIDAQLLESRNYSVEEICRWFLVDPSLIGFGGKDSNWGTGLEQKMIGFVTLTLSSWIRRIEQSISINLLTPAQRQTQYAQYNLEALLRGDSASRAEFYSKMTQNGIYTRDDCRVKENLPRRGGNADVLTVQTNLAPIDQLGTQSESAKVQAVLNNWLNQDN